MTTQKRQRGNAVVMDGTGSDVQGRPIACIVLPTYNEAPNVEILLPLIFDQAERIPSHELHVLVVDDESPDGTQEVVRTLMRSYSRLHLIVGRKVGLGAAYQRGIDHALRQLSPDLLLQMDADLQHAPELLPLFVSLSHYGFSVVIGSRFAPGGGTPNFSLRRRTMSLVGNWMVRFMGGLPRIHDCTSGYRCIKADLLRRSDLSFLSTRGYSFQSSLLCELLRNGGRPVEIPIVFGERTHGASKLSLADQVEFLVNIARIRFRRSRELVQFGVVGSSGVLFNMAALYVLTRLAGQPLEFASAVAIETSILWNYACHRVWGAGRRDVPTAQPVIRFGRFHSIALAAGLSNYVVLLFLTRTLHVFDLLANMVGIAIGMFLAYPLNSLWAWKELAATNRNDPHA